MSKNKKKFYNSFKIQMGEFYNIEKIDNFVKEFMENIDIPQLVRCAYYSDNIDDIATIARVVSTKDKNFLPIIIKNSLTLFPEEEVSNHSYFKKFNIENIKAIELTYKINVEDKEVFQHNDKEHLIKDYRGSWGEFDNKILLFCMAFNNNIIERTLEITKYFIENLHKIFVNTSNDQFHAENLENYYINSLTKFIESFIPSQQKLIINMHEKNLLTSKEGIKFLISILNNQGELKKAKEIAENALKECKEEEINSTYLLFLYESLQCLEVKSANQNKAIEWGVKALAIYPNDEVIIINLLFNAAQTNNQKIFSLYINKLPKGSALKTLFSQYNNYFNKKENFSKKIVDGLKENDISSNYQIFLKDIKFLADQESRKNNKPNEKHFNNGITYLKNNGQDIFLLITHSIHYKYFNTAKRLLEEAKKLITGNSEFILTLQACLNNGKDQKLFNNIQESNLVDSRKNKLHIKAAESIIAEIKPNDDDKTVKIKLQNANKHIKEALKINPENTINIKNAILYTAISNDKIGTDEIIKALPKEELNDILIDFVTDQANSETVINKTQKNTEQTIEQLYETLNHKKIHTYYQDLKAQKLEQLSKPAPSGWKIFKTIYIEFNEATYIGLHKGPKGGSLEYYAYLSPKISKGNVDQMQQAMEKGFIHRAGQNGVIEYANKIFKLKSNQDIRAVTKDVYINEDNNALLSFDDYFNHSGVEDYIQLSGGIEYHYV